MYVVFEVELKIQILIRDRPLFFYYGVTIFGIRRQFFKKNAFQILFSLHFVIKTIFHDHVEERISSFIYLIKKTLHVYLYM